MSKKRILFVCTGNICRSPTAEAVLRKRAADLGLALEIDSAGTHGYHVGEPPDERAIAIAAARGYDLAPLRARQVTARDFAAFDLILALDQGHLRLLERRCPPEQRHRLKLFLDFAAERGALPKSVDVPDPYYGGESHFGETLALIELGVEALLASFAEPREKSPAR